ncbi:hypothetical protein J4558_22870 [Leptolyngbya sp. 15MV]|nr:hypothetical protein J4558_22870 [Leptolyngbya sp. 15MV]
MTLHATQQVTLSGAVSSPEGNSEDRNVLDASQIRSAALPRTYIISLTCEGPGANALRGEAGSGLVFGCGTTFETTFGASNGGPTPGRNDLQIAPAFPGSTATPRRTTGDAVTTLSLRIYMPDDAPPGLVSYVLRVVAAEQISTQSELVSSSYTVDASSTTVTTFSQTITPTEQHQLQIRFSQLIDAHSQTFRLRLLCTGVGTALVVAVADTGDGLLCGGSVERIFESLSSNSAPGTVLSLDFVQTDALASVNYTLRVEPVSPYVPIAPDDVLSEPYQLAISTTAQTAFSQAISAPLGDSSDRIQAIIPTMIGGQTAGRNFTFWLQCVGESPGGIYYLIELQGGIQHYGLCDVPLTLYIDESVGSPPRPFIMVSMAGEVAEVSAGSFRRPDGQAVFRVRVALSADHLGDPRRGLPLVPGMSVSAEIATGGQSLLGWLAKPVRAALDTAFSER